MQPKSPPAPRWRRALALAGRFVALVFKVIFVVLLVAIPIPIFAPRYRPHRERKNQVAMVVRKEEER